MLSSVIKGATAVVTVGLSLGTAGAASASTTATHQPKPVEAITTIVGRDDSGGGGTWAKDNFTRDLKVYYLGRSTDPAHAAAPYMYYATVSDNGTFRDLPGQLTPNQGGRYQGTELRDGQVSGPMSGFGQWSLFYASQKAHNGLAPAHLGSAISNLPAYSSVTWPELAFPSGTVFTGPDGQAADAMNEISWGYDYQAVPFTKFVVKTVNGKKVIVKVTGFRQHWSDTALNGDGQLPRDGNILGVR
jgi:cyclic lactone autoinducer peptide